MFKNVQYRDGKSTKLVAQYNIISLQLMIIVQIKSVQDEIVFNNYNKIVSNVKFERKH